jgi:nucleoid-associated protein YgaU
MAPSIGRIVVASLALVAVSGAAVAFGVTHVWRKPPPAATAATAVPAASPDASEARDERSVTLAKAKAEADAVAAELAVSPLPPAGDQSVPGFDVARIEPTGEAVIAGRAAPGATVELLGNSGERLDQAVADQSGQFVMTPSQLPRGKYELTLKSRLPDGTLATSKHGVPVALDEAPSSTGALASRAEAPSSGSGRDGLSQQPHATAAAALPDGGASSAAGDSKRTTRVVSRGDSLWHISRVIYGVGTQYAVVYRANRERIQDPNRIYPGQIFVLPMKPR